MGNSTICADPTYIFADFDNLSECDKEFGILNTDDENAYINTVWDCVNDYCREPDSRLKGCESSDDDGWFYVVREGGSGYFTGDMCIGINSEVNSDLGGPGVFISYLMQIGIVFYVFLFLRVFHLGPKVVSFATRFKHCHDTESTNARGDKIRHYFKQHDLILKTVLVEFQEAQCFLMLASQAAILAARKFKAVYEASTYQMLIANEGIASMVSMAGILPVVITMWSLQKWHRNSPWIFFLSCATFVLSEVALYIAPLPQIKNIDRVKSNYWPESCGGLPPPLIYCIDPWTGGQVLSPQQLFRYILNPFCSLIWLTIVIKWIWSYVHDRSKPPPRRGTLRSFLYLQKIHDWLQRFRQTKWGVRLWRLFSAFTVIVELLFILAVCVDARCFWFIRTMNIIDFGHWSFGQLVAITVWLPVISKYFLLMGGISSYSRSRFPKGYRIVKERTTDTEKDVSQSAYLPVSSSRDSNKTPSRFYSSGTWSDISRAT